MNMFKKLSLKAKLLGLSVITVLVTAMGAWLSLQSMSESYEKSTFFEIESYSSKVSDAIAAQFFERYGDVQAFALNEAIKSGDATRIEPVLNSYVALYGIYDVILVVDKRGRYVGSNSKDPSGKDLNLNKLKVTNYANDLWFKSVVSGKTSDSKEKNFSGTYFEDFIEDHIVASAMGEKKYGSSFSAAIKDEKGELLGVITNRAGERWVLPDIQTAYEALKQAGLPSAEVVLFNSKGQYIQDFSNGNSRAERILGKSFYDENSEFKQLINKREKGYYRGVESGSKEEEIITFTRLGGSKWIDEFNWVASVHTSSSEAFLSIVSAKNTFIVMMSIASVLALTFSVLFSVLVSKAFNQATNSLSENSHELNEASIKIASQSTELSESATEQAAALQETMSAVDEISAMVEKNAEAANRSKDVSENSKVAAERGREIVDQMIEAIGDIDKSNNEISEEIAESNQQPAEITKLINDIGSKTKVINEIVFQTKLLSFNASVEAARAGEYGKGFSVVAEEVGNLAQMSGNAAKEITALLDESVSKVNQIVSDSKTRVDRILQVSKSKVQAGSKVANECNEALGEILTNVASVDSLVSEIAVASQEQSAGIKEISKAVGQMEQVTQQNSSVAQSSSSAAEQLRAQAAALNELVELISSQVNGNSKAVESEVPRENVVPLKKKSPERPKLSLSGHKASGTEYVPAANDPGFGED
jgi:methyl-accepting chemotaxis protein